MARARSSVLLLAAALALAASSALRTVLAFVGAQPSRQLRVASPVVRQVGVDYLLRNGPKDADPALIDPTGASGATHEVIYKKRPFGIARYAPGKDGNGAVIMEVTQKSRYPGDPQGQAFVAGVQPNWVVSKINGQDAKGTKFEDLMEYMDDEVLDPVAALSLNLKERGVSSNFAEGQSEKSLGEASFVFGGGATAEMPITIEYQEQ